MKKHHTTTRESLQLDNYVHVVSIGTIMPPDMYSRPTVFRTCNSHSLRAFFVAVISALWRLRWITFAQYDNRSWWLITHLSTLMFRVPSAFWSIHHADSGVDVRTWNASAPAWFGGASIHFGASHIVTNQRLVYFNELAADKSSIHTMHPAAAAGPLALHRKWTF